MSNSNHGITFGNKIGMIEDAVIQQQSFISRILQSIQTLLENDESNQSNKKLTKEFNQIVNDFQQQQKNFDFNSDQDLQIFSKIDSNNKMINEHQIKLEDMDSELKTIKFLLNNLKDGAQSDDDFEEYKKKIAEIEENRTKSQIDPIVKSIKCIKYEIKQMKKNNSNTPQNENITSSNDYNNLNHVIKCMKYELKKLKNKIESNENIESKIQDDLKPLKFPEKLQEFKREFKQHKKFLDDVEKTLIHYTEKVDKLQSSVDNLQSSVESLGENSNDADRQDILSQQEKLKEKIDELTAQINLLDKQKIEQKGLDQARDDLQNLKDAINIGMQGNTSNSEEEDSDITNSNMLEALRSLKHQVSDLSNQNKRLDQNINQLLDNSTNLNNTSCENADSRIQAIEERLANFDSLASNIVQESAPFNEMRNSIKCLKFEVKKLKTALNENNETNAALKERAVGLANNSDNDSNSRRLNELENEVQNLNDLNDRVQELTDSVNTLREQQTNPVESFDNSAIKRDIQCLKYEIKRLKNKQSQRNDEELDAPNSKIDAIEANISDIKQELQTTIQDELKQYNGKLQSLENTMLTFINQLNNEKEKTTRDSSNTENWPLIQIPAEKHEVNPLIGIIREKIHSLVDEMNQAPDQSEEVVTKMKPSMDETQDQLKKLQETLNTLLVQEEYQTVQLTPQLLWDDFTELKNRVSALENRRHRSQIKNRDIAIGEEEDYELDYDQEIRKLKYSVKCLKYEMKKFKENEFISSASEQLDLIAKKVSELYGSQHQAIKVVNTQSAQIQEHQETINDQLSRIEELEESIKNLEANGQNQDEIDQLTSELNDLKDKLLLIEEENEKFKGQINLLEEHSYAFLGPTSTSKKDPNPIIMMLEAQVTELLQQIEDPTLKEEPDETGELHPTMDQAEQDLITVQKELRELLEQEQADAKHETARAFNLVQKHTQNRINHLEKIIRKQNETYKAVREFYNDIESIKFRINELSNSQQQVIRNINMQNDQIDSTKSVLSRDVIPQLNDIHSQFDEHLDDHALLSTQIPSTSKDSVIKHTPNPVVESLREQINNLLVQMENPDVKETCENEKNENLKPSMEQLQKNLTVLQDTLQRILNSQVYIPLDETLGSFQDQINLLQDKYIKQTREINELKKCGNDQLESRINELEETINELKKQNLETINKQIYGEEIAKESDRITSLEKELQNLKEILGKQRFSPRGEIEQPIMKTDSEGHFIIRKTKHLNGTANQNVRKLKRQIDELTEKIRKAELDEEEDDGIDGELHDHLGKTSDDLIVLRAQLQRILEGYEVDEVVPISPQEMYEQLVDLQGRVDQLEGNPSSVVKTRNVNLASNQPNIQQLSSSFNKYAQQLNAQTSYIHQFKETLDELADRVSDNESSLEEIRNQLQDGAAFDELRSVQEEIQRMKEQLELSDDYDVIEIEGGDADVEVQLEEDKNDNDNNHHHRYNDLPLRVRKLEKRIAQLENGSPNLQLREVLTADGLPYSEAGFNDVSSSSLYQENPQIKVIQDQIDLLMKELNNSEFDSDEDDQTHVKTNVEATKKQLKVLQDALEDLIREDKQERIRLATLSPQKLLYKLDELNAKFNELPQDLGQSIDYLKSEVNKINETLNDNTNQLHEHLDDFGTLTGKVNGIIGAQNLVIQNSNAQNQKIKVLTELVEDEEQKKRLDEIEEEFRNHIENHEELVTSFLPVNGKSKGKTRSVKVSREPSQKEVSPYIKGIQNQIDALINNMNDLNEQQKQDEKEDKELDSRISETETELLLLQETLGSLQNFDNEYEIQEEEEDSNDLISNKVIKKLQFNIGCLKYEVKRLKRKQKQQEKNQNIQTRGISLVESNELTSKVDNLENKLNQLSRQIQSTNEHKINHLEGQIKDLNKQLQDQPEQILSSLQLLWSKSPKGTSKYTSKKKAVNPVIQDIQDQIDVLVSKMNDPSMMDQDQDDEELAPQIKQTQDELAILQETLKTLMEGIEEEEEEDTDNVDHLYISPALVLSRLIKIEKEFMKNSEMKTAIHCLKHEVKHVKYQDGYLQTLWDRTEALTQSQNSVIQAIKVFKSYLATHKDQEIKGQILELEERVSLLENQPPFPVIAPAVSDQMSLNSATSLPISSSSRMIREIHKPRNVSPIIKEIQDQIDALVRKMNDPSIKKQKEKGTLTPSFQKTQAQLAKLRATLKRLQEMEDVEIVEDDINRVEDDEFFNVPGNYLSKQLLVENISYLHHKVNSEIIPSIRCIKHELRNIKQNGLSIKSRGIVLDPQEEEEQNEKLRSIANNYDNLMNRIEEITASQSQVIYTINQHKRMIDQANEKLETVTDSIEDRLENGEEKDLLQRIENIEQNMDDLQSNGFAQATTISPRSKSREVNPIIQLLKDRIDELVEQMNDPELQNNDEQTNNELNPSLNKAENEVLILREQLRKLLEEEEEEEIVVTPESLYRMIQDNKNKLATLEENNSQKQSEIIQNLENEIKQLKKKLGDSEGQDRLQLIDEKIDNLTNRSEEYINSHYKLIQNNNANKSIVDKINNQLTEQQRTITDNYEDLESRVALLEEGQNVSPYSFWGQPISRSAGKKPINPAIRKIKHKVDELVVEMNDPIIPAKDAEQLKPRFNKAETELRTLQDTLTTIIGDDDGNDEELEEVITPISLYQMIRDLQDKVSSLEETNNQNPFLSRSIVLGGSPSKKKITRKKYNNPEMEKLKKKIEELVEQMNDPSIEETDNNNSSSSVSLKSSFTKAENELQMLKDLLNTLLEETEEETDNEDQEEPITIETLPDILTNLRSRSVNLDQSNNELRRMVQCLKYEVKKLKSKNQQSSDRPQMTEEELMAYCDRLEQIAQRYDKHIVEAKNEMKRYREIKSQMKKDNELSNSLQRDIKCLKYEVKNLKLKNPRRSGNSSKKGGLNDDNGLGGFDNDDDDNDNGGGPNKRTRSSNKSSQSGKNGGSSKGKGGSGKSTHQNKTLEERVDIIEDSQEKVIQNVNSQHSYLEEVNNIIQQFSSKLNDHDKRIEELESFSNNEIDPKNITKRSLPFETLDSEQPEDDLEQLKKRINELTGSQQSIVKGFNSQNQSIQQIKDQIEDILSKQEDDNNEIKELVQNRDILLPSTDENAQESIERIEEELNELKSSQQKIINNNNVVTGNIRQIKEKLKEIEMFQQQQQEEKENEIINENAVEFDEDTLNSIKCLKYEMKRLKNKVNENAAQFNEDTLNSIKCLKYEMKRLKNKVNDLILKQKEHENKIQEHQDELEVQSRNIRNPEENEESQRKLNCMKYETKKLKENIHFIDDKINQITSSQKLITDNVNSQTNHIREIKAKLNELDMKQQDQEQRKEEELQPIVQTRDISLLSSDLENRIDEISSSHSILVKTLNAQKSQIDKIKEKLDETMINQQQIMENTDNLMALQDENINNNNEQNLYQPSNEQILRIEKELTELQKNHLHLKSQFYDHINEQPKSNNNISQPVLDSINQIVENQRKIIQTTNAQSSLIRELQNRVSAHEASISELFNEAESNNENNSYQNQIDSLEDKINQLISSSNKDIEERVIQLIASQNRAIQTINNQTGNLRKHENEINLIKNKIDSLQNESNLNFEDEIEIIKQDIENLKDENNQRETHKNEEISSLNDQLSSLENQISPLEDEISSLKDQISSLENIKYKTREAILPENNNNNNGELEYLKKSIKCIKYELKKIIMNKENNNNNNSILSTTTTTNNVDGDLKKIKAKIIKMDQFNNDQLVPHINQLEENNLKQKEKITKLIQYVEKMKQDVKQLNDIFNISPFLITTGDEQRKMNLKTFFESVAKTINDHSSTLVNIEQRLSNQENQTSSFFPQQQQSQPQSPKSKQNQKIKDENIANFVSTAEFQKYTQNNNLQIEQLMKKISSNNKSSNNDQISYIKKEIDSLKIPEIRKDIDTIKNNLKNSTTTTTTNNKNHSENQKVDLLQSRIDKLEEQLENKIAEIDSRNNEIEEMKAYSHKLAKHIKAQEEKIKVIRETINNK